MYGAPSKSVQCPKCGASFQVPMLPGEVRAEIATLVRAEQKVEAMHQLVVRCGMNMVDAKAVVMHIATPKNHCNRCHGPVAEIEETLCASCNAFNLNW